MDLTVEEALPIIAKMLCELHTESKKPYELEFGYASDATDHAFIRVNNPKRCDHADDFTLETSWFGTR